MGLGFIISKKKIADEKLEAVMYEFEDNGVPIMSTGKFFQISMLIWMRNHMLALFMSWEIVRLSKCRRE